jgi:hypothetical protein
MAEENKPEDEEVEGSEDESEEEESEEGSEEESGSGALAGLAGAAAAGALAAKGGKKPAKGKTSAKAKKGAKPAPAKAAPAKPAAKPSISKDGSVDVNAKIDEIQQLADKNKVWTVAGYSFTPAKLMILGTILSSALGGLYGAFEVYKDYQDMKKKIANYVTPDLSELYKKMEVLDANTGKMTEYTNNIKNDLKQDVRRLEGVVESLERASKTDQRLTDATVKDIKRDVDQTLKEIRKYTDENVKDMNRELVKNQKEQQSEIRALRSEVDNKIKQAVDNPLANK